ncbi:serine/threonine protein kinase [Bacillus sp. OV322]|uniref:serine/threonine protein kinase n=1 Tax=Bacillus sp. OV322 TaxID=1882764 RepID=UPI0008E9940C|nr:serine/threonine protein kinase [Bacillus sp. OV322]SFC50632.1 serine/threonine protein kinase [Bacillus sp. OV322]
MKNNDFTYIVENELLGQVKIERIKPHDPLIVKNIPLGWKCIGTGNYAAVFVHKSEPKLVVKVVLDDSSALEKEARVYQQLGEHPAYSKLIHKGGRYLILKRLEGITLYDAIIKGIRIPERVIKDINEALVYAVKRGLNPYDVHGKNVMMKHGRGYVVDISDFHKKGKDEKWNDLVKAYYKFYIKTLYRMPVKIPSIVLDFVRHSYRIYKKIRLC